MHFIEIIYQIALFATTFFIAHYIFNYFIFKNRIDMYATLVKSLQMAVLYTIVSFAMRYMVEHYFTGAKNSSSVQLASGQVLQVPVEQKQDTDAVVIEPLNLELNLGDLTVTDAMMTTVSTKRGVYSFLEESATLQSINLFWNESQQVPLLKESSANFLIAFDEGTPCNYRLVSNKSTGAGTHEIAYQAVYNGATIHKKFVLYDDSYRIDVTLGISDLNQDNHVRLVLPMPSLSEQLTGIVNKTKASGSFDLQTIDLKHHAVCQKFWFEPKLFGLSAHYFSHICFDASRNAIQRSYIRSELIQKSKEKAFQALLESKKLCGDSELSWSFYCGPKSEQDLIAVSLELASLVDYGFFAFLAKPLAKFLTLIKEQIGNYGWAIIIMTLLIKLLMIPFTLRAEKGMKAQAEFEKKRQHLQQKYKHDKEALDKALSELISKQGLPILSGCLPMLLNIPVFLALNKVLTSCTELYGASFLWMPDLTAADPYYVLSMLVFMGMIFVPQPQQTTGPRQVFSKMGFALFLAAVTSYISSGLGLFIVVNTLFGLVQNPLVHILRRFIKA